MWAWLSRPETKVLPFAESALDILGFLNQGVETQATLLPIHFGGRGKRGAIFFPIGK